MPYYTPLRYPGGKRRLFPLVERLLEENRLHDVDYVEPYAGGAAVALAMLFEERATTIHINDLSRPIYAFWHAVLNDTEDLCRRLRRAKVTMPEWHRQRAVYDQRDTAPLDDLAFATLFLNRTNRSGIIGGGVIGGKAQQGQWGVAARFNAEDLAQRIARIGRYRSRIHLYSEDALALTQRLHPQLGPRTFTFYDPPYIEKSEQLYLNNYTPAGHQALATGIRRLTTPWVVTYDRAALALGLYAPHRRLLYGLHYSAQDRYEAQEVMFFDRRLKLPAVWSGPGPVTIHRGSSGSTLRGELFARHH